MRFRDLLIVLATICLGFFFLLAGAGKLLMGSDAFSPMAATPLSYLPPNVEQFVYFIVPFVEVIIGLLLVFSIAVRFTAAVSSVLIAGFIATNLYILSKGIEDCDTCFGVFGSLSIYSALILDGIMVLLIIAVVLFHPSNFMEMRPWFAPVHKPDGVPSLGAPRAGEICKS